MEKENTVPNVSSYRPKLVEVLSTSAENREVFDVREIMHNMNSLQKACKDAQSKIPYTSPSTGKTLHDPSVLIPNNRVSFFKQIDEETEQENELNETTDRDTTMHMVWETPKQKIKSVDSTVCYDETSFSKLYRVNSSHDKGDCSQCKTSKVKKGNLSAELGHRILQRQKEIRKQRLTASLYSCHSKSKISSESENDFLRKELELQKQTNQLEKERNSLLEKISEFNKEKESLKVTQQEVQKKTKSSETVAVSKRSGGESVVVNIVLVFLGYVLFYLITEMVTFTSLI